MTEVFDPNEKLVWSIALESPLGGDCTPLFQRHAETMFAQSPPESIHMLDARKLAVPGVRFYVMRVAGWAVGMGALKAIDPTHAELKSMHVLVELRRRGLAWGMLEHLIAEARAAGHKRVSLETGTHEGFRAARTLYAGAGFEYCEPFEGYVLDPHSVFMTRSI